MARARWGETISALQTHPATLSQPSRRLRISNDSQTATMNWPRHCHLTGDILNISSVLLPLLLPQLTQNTSLLVASDES